MSNLLESLEKNIQDNLKRLDDSNISLEDREKLTKLTNDQLAKYSELYKTLCEPQNQVERLELDREKLEFEKSKFTREHDLTTLDVNSKIELESRRINQMIEQNRLELEQKEKLARKERRTGVLTTSLGIVGGLAVGAVTAYAKYRSNEAFARNRESFEQQGIYSYSTGKKLSSAIDLR